MKNFIAKTMSVMLIAYIISGCARDLSSVTYTSDATLNIVLHGQVLSSRKVKIRESDKLEAGAGTAVGALGGGAAAGAGSNGSMPAIIGGAVVGGIFGTVAERSLSSSTGIEYIVKVDTSKLKGEYYEGSALMRNSLAAVKTTGIVTVVQALEKKEDAAIEPGQKVLIIVSEKRTRIIPDLTN
jgi:outer membrane lipoprotein SlyB